MAGKKSRAAGEREEETDDVGNGSGSNFRFRIAQIYGLHVDCPHAACRRHRTCSRPAAVPCYGRHLADLRRYAFPRLRRAIERAQRECEQRRPPSGSRLSAVALAAPGPQVAGKAPGGQR
jgi:hypothetical protein